MVLVPGPRGTVDELVNLTVVLTWGIFAPQGTLRHVRRYFRHSCGGWKLLASAGCRDATDLQCTGCLPTLPQTTKDQSAQNISSTKVENSKDF